jgi:hypothetical protein
VRWYRVNCSLTPVQEAFKKKTDRKAFFPDYECSLNCALPAIFDLSLLGGSPFHEASEGPSDELELKR